MRRTVWAGAGLMVLAACSGGADPVGENSAGSIKTTAVGNVVGAIPSPTPTPDPMMDAAATTDANAAASDAMAGAADSMMSNDAAQH